jgi:hypothetical protein
MVIVEKISNVAQLLLNAASSGGTVGFRNLHALFDEGAHKNDVYDTLEAASRALCHSSVAIYSAVMAKNSDGCPGSGFYDIFNNLRRDEFKTITGHNDLHQLTDEDRTAVVAAERDRVYQHAEENY